MDSKVYEYLYSLVGQHLRIRKQKELIAFAEQNMVKPVKGCIGFNTISGFIEDNEYPFIMRNYVNKGYWKIFRIVYKLETEEK